jgi:hypothetical protein
MRNPDAAPVTATRAFLPPGRPGDAPTQLVCLALALALFALAARIASIW